jgi:ribose transport system permease protein
MSSVAAPAGPTRAEAPSIYARARALMRESPVIPLIGLLVLLVVALELLRPGFVGVNWGTTMVRQAIPLAILAACQTIAMLTGGIDLSVAAIASMTGFLVATLLGSIGLPAAIVIALACALLAGLVNGIGIGVFRVHPLIMTLGMGLIVFGLSNVWQVQRVQTGSGVPAEFRTIGAGTFLGIFPNSLLLFIPLAAILLLLLHRTGYGRLLYAIGDNPVAARLSGVRSWQVLTVLYVISGLLAGIAGFVYAGFINQVSVSLVESSLLPSVAAAVIGGTSILGGRGGYGGTIVGALILAVASALLNALGFREADRLILFGSIIIFFTAAYARITSDT